MLQTRKAQELDVVKLTEDLPQYDLPKGAQGTVVEVFDNLQEGYMVEFTDESGTDFKIADWVLPSQIENLDDKAVPFFKQGLELLNQGNFLKAATEFRQAFELKPTLIRLLHNIISGIAQSEDWLKVARGMRFIIELSPTYELPRWNLAIAYVNYGVQRAKENNFHESLGFFLRAFRIETPVSIEKLIRENLAAAQSALGIEAHRSGELERTVACMESALTWFSSSETRSNLGTAYSVLADNLLCRGAFEDAIVNYIAAEETGVFTTEGLNNRAIALVHMMQTDEALEAFQMALAIDPNNTVAQQNLNLLRQNLPNVQDAIIERFRTEEGTLQFSALTPPRPVAMNSIVTA